MKKLSFTIFALLLVFSGCKSAAQSDEDMELSIIKEGLYADFYKEQLIVEVGQIFDYEKALKNSNGNVSPIQDLNQPLRSPGEYSFTFLVESKRHPEVSKIVEVVVLVTEVSENSLLPKFEGINLGKVVEQGSLVNLYRGVTARDYNGDIIPFEVIGEWNTNAVGEYLVTYRAVDVEGNEAVVDIFLQVVASGDSGNNEITQTRADLPILCKAGTDESKECDWVPRSAEVAKSNLFLYAEHKNSLDACKLSGESYIEKFKEIGYKGQYRCISLKNNKNEEVGYELWKYKLPIDSEQQK